MMPADHEPLQAFGQLRQDLLAKGRKEGKFTTPLAAN